MSCKPKQCDCDDLACKLEAAEKNIDELFQRTEELKAALDEASPFVIAFAGDCGTANDYQAAMMEEIEKWSPDIIILGGDNNYPDGDDDDADENLAVFDEYIDAEKVFPVIGNHDDGTNPIPSPSNYLYRKFPYALSLPNFDYQYKIPGKDVELFFVYDGYISGSTISDYGIDGNGSEQARLAQRLLESEATNKIIFIHRNISGPSIDGETHRYQSDGLSNIDLKALGVVAIVSGHTHTAYHLLGNDGVVDGVHLVDCSATTETPREFADPYAIIGFAGVDTKWKYDEETRYVLRIAVSSKNIRFQFHTYDSDIHHAFNISI